MVNIVIMIIAIYAASVACGILSHFKREKDWRALMLAFDDIFTAETFDELVEKVDVAYQIADRQHDKVFNKVRDNLYDQGIIAANIKHLWPEKEA